MRKLPYRLFAVASMLRGHKPRVVANSLRNIGLCQNFSETLLPETQTKQFSEDRLAFDKSDTESKILIAQNYGVAEYIKYAEERDESWIELWDILSVPKYRNYILILGAVPGGSVKDITESFNRKFSREISSEIIALLIKYFWDLKKMTTLDIKRAVADLKSPILSRGINKILYGNHVAALKSVGAFTKLNYTLILEEMLFETYHRYKEGIANNKSQEDLKCIVADLLKVGDRLDKISKKSTDVDALRTLMEDLKIEHDKSSRNMDDFLKNNEVV